MKSEGVLKLMKAMDGALLLRPHSLAEEESSGDYDILTPGEISPPEGMRIMGEKPNTIVSRKYVWQHYYSWGQVDLLPVLEWNGLPYMDAERVIRNAVVDGEGVRRPCPGDDGCISWLTSLLWGGFYKIAYEEVITNAAREEGAAMKGALTWALGEEWAEKMWSWAEQGRAQESAKHVGQIRKALMISAFKRAPLETLANVARHWSRELVLHIRPPMPMIAFLGPDGSGKSTVIAGLKDSLKKRRIGVATLHWRPGVFNANKMAEGEVVTDPHGKPPRGFISSILKLILLVADWQVGYWLRFRHAQAKARIVISDRFYDDLLIDPKRYRYGAGRSLARFFFRAAPKPDLIFVLHGSAEEIYKRKQEVSFEELDRQLSSYKTYTVNKKASHLINVNRPIETIVDEIQSLIVAHQIQKHP